MSSSRKNFSTGYKIVKDDFQFAVGKIFEKQYKSRDCNNSIFIKVLFCALCHVQSLFAACRNLSNVPGDHAIAAAILKTLPEYTRLQKLIKRLLKQCRSVGLKCSLLLLDRGFYSVNVISYLKHAQVPFVMPVIETSYRQIHECRIRTRYEKVAVEVVIFCVGDDDAKLLDLVRADVRDEQRSPVATGAGDILQFQGFVASVSKNPRKRIGLLRRLRNQTRCGNLTCDDDSKSIYDELLKVESGDQMERAIKEPQLEAAIREAF